MSDPMTPQMTPKDKGDVGSPTQHIPRPRRRNDHRRTRSRSRSRSNYSSRSRHKHSFRRTRRARRYRSTSLSSTSSSERVVSRKRRRSRSYYCSVSSSSKPSRSDSSLSSPIRRKRRSRSNTRRTSHKRQRRNPSQHNRHDESMLDKFIDAIGKHGRNSFNSAHDVIPTFDPNIKSQSTRAWLKKVNQISAIYKWNEKQTIFHALSKLSGLAKRWYEGLSTVDLNWKEWQRKLMKNFPDDRNYAERLAEMLDRKSRRNETLEEYFYDKATLVSHCNIKGKDAVDCIIHGIYDHNIRLNAQGANFKSPNKLLRYMRSISHRNARETNPAKPMNPQKSYPTVTGRSTEHNKTRGPNNMNRTIRCFNCSELGHASPRCPKERQKCTKCNLLGHVADYCRRDGDSWKRSSNAANKPNDNSSVVNKIQQNEVGNAIPNKYYKTIKLNGVDKSAFIDFGSQCTMIKESTFRQLNLNLELSQLPILKGFAFGSMQPLGRVFIHVCIDLVKVDVDAFVVPDEFLNCDVLIGQNLTERPEIVVHKDNTSLTLYSNDHHLCKIELYSKEKIEFQGIKDIDFICNKDLTGHVYVSGSVCFKNDEEYIVLPGVYSVLSGEGKVIAATFSNASVNLRENHLLARARILPINIPPIIPRPSFEVNMTDVDRHHDSIHGRTSEITADLLNIGPDVKDEDRDKILKLVNEYRDCFALTIDELGKTSISEMHIRLHDESPVTYKPYRLPYSERILVRDIINQLMENDIVKESDSPYASPIVLVRKKNGEPRLCVDYRALNKKTIKDSYPMPVIDDQLDRLSGKRYFTSLDLKSGYYQIPMSQESRHLTAFITPDGHYEYTRMPFGLVNAPAVFQHMINKALGRDRYDLAMPYLDDLLTPATTVEEGLHKLKRIFDSLREAGLTLNIEKCFFFETSLDYLGYEVSQNGLRPGKRKVEAVASFPVPTNVHQVRQFVGLASFFRRFIPNFASVAKPLTILTKANSPWTWDEPQRNAFEELKTKLVERPILALYDPKHLTEVHCDASKIGIGGILFQKPDENSPLRPVAYYSKQTTKEEQYLHSYELETLAVVQSLKKFRTYLIGLSFKVYTDCNALKSTLTKRDLIPRIARWWLLLQEYDFTVEYRAGDKMKHADALSRNPIRDESDKHDDLADARQFDILRIDTLDTTQWLQTVQMTDPKLKLIKTILGQSTKDIKDILNNYELKDDKLYRKIGNSLKWVVPNACRWRICQLCHDESGHFSTEKTLDKMKQTYWFPKMKRFVNKYVSACMSCAFNKGTSTKKSGYLHPIPKGNTPFHTLHMDHLGPFVRSKLGNSYIFAVIDGFSKFIFIRAVKNLKSKTTIRILQDIFDVIGCPKVIVSDRGTSFTSASFRDYIKSIGVKHVLNAVATPRANGQIERYNRSILDSLASSNHGSDEREWDTHVGKVQWSLNNTINKGIGTSPSEIVFGRRTTNTSEGIIQNALQENEDSDITKIDEVRSKAKRHIEKTQGHMKEYYDRNKAPTKFFNEGDLVMIPNHCLPADGRSKKLVKKYRGPFKISAVLDHDRYEITSIPGFTKRAYKSVYPADQMKKWITFTETDTPTNNSESAGDDGEDTDIDNNE